MLTATVHRSQEAGPDGARQPPSSASSPILHAHADGGCVRAPGRRAGRVRQAGAGSEHWCVHRRLGILVQGSSHASRPAPCPLSPNQSTHPTAANPCPHPATNGCRAGRGPAARPAPGGLRGGVPHPAAARPGRRFCVGAGEQLLRRVRGRDRAAAGRCRVTPARRSRSTDPVAACDMLC